MLFIIVCLCRDFVGDDPFCVFLGDNIFQDKMESLLRGFEASDSEAAIVLREVPDPSRFGIAVLKDNQIVRVVEKHGGDVLGSTDVLVSGYTHPGPDRRRTVSRFSLPVAACQQRRPQTRY